jgi:hypothetical protein
MADAPDSKSGGVNPREGSSPSSGTRQTNLIDSYDGRIFEIFYIVPKL